MRILSAAIASGMLATVTVCSAADATTVDFAFKEGAVTEAQGSFSYTSANPVLGYADLTAFSLTIGAANYDLAYALSATDYSYFAFDTTTDQFVPGSASGCFGGPFNALLSAVGNCFASGGYFIKPGADDTISEFTQGIYDEPYDTIVVDLQGSTQGVPEPGTLSLVGAMSLLALVAFRRRSAFAGL